MQSMESTPNLSPSEQTDDPVQIKDILFLCLSQWKWFVLSLVITLSVAFLYLMRTPSVYTRTAAVLIKENTKGQSLSSDMGFSDMGLFQSSTNVNNELLVMQSPAIMLEVVKRLHLDMNYLLPGRFHDQVAYGSTLPLTVTMPDLSDNASGQCVIGLHGDGSVELSEFLQNGTEMPVSGPVTGRLLDTLATPLGRIIVQPTPYLKPETEYPAIRVTKANLYGTVSAYSSKLKVSINDSKASVIDLTINDVSIQRAEDILNTLISVYNENWVRDKNQIAVSTSMFINERLGIIEQELGNVDENISSYKSENLLPDVQVASSIYMAESSEANAQIMNLNNQLYMTKYVRNYLTNEANRTQLLPANSGIEGGNIESQISEYNNLLLQRNSLVSNSSTQNPLVIDMDQSLAEMRKAIIVSIDNVILTLNTKISSLQQNKQQATARIAANPSQAKYLLSVERQQKVKEALYLFLLQKREENELSQAFTAYNTRIITPPSGSMAPTSPVRRNILLIAIVIGLCIPVGVIFLLETLNQHADPGTQGYRETHHSVHRRDSPVGFEKAPLVQKERGRGEQGARAGGFARHHQRGLPRPAHQPGVHRGQEQPLERHHPHLLQSGQRQVVPHDQHRRLPGHQGEAGTGPRRRPAARHHLGLCRLATARSVRLPERKHRQRRADHRGGQAARDAALPARGHHSPQPHRAA